MANFFQAKKTNELTTKHQTFIIERLDHQGVGIAYHNKKPVFIESCLPGEEVVAQLIEQKSKYARAKLISIKTPSEQRIDAFCPHYQICGGCNLQHLSHDDQIELKSQSLSQLMQKFAGKHLVLEDSALALESPVLSKPLGYRRRARISLMFDNKRQQLQFGFRQKASKNIVNLDNCPVLDPNLNEFLPKLRDLLDGFKQPRDLGHVELVSDGNLRAVLLRHTAALDNQDRQTLLEFATEKQLTLYLQPNSGELECLTGENLQCTETGSKIPFLPTDFIQVNQGVNQAMVAQAINWLEIDAGDRILDLFCGLGNFSFELAKQAKYVVGIEGVEAMVSRAKSNANLNGLKNIEFHQADLEQDLRHVDWAAKPFDKILLDPARAGALGVIDNIAKLGAKSVVYVSCNPATLARDSHSLLSQGYQLQKLAMLDMFPHTSHLESMALFVKVAKGSLLKGHSKSDIKGGHSNSFSAKKISAKVIGSKDTASKVSGSKMTLAKIAAASNGSKKGQSRDKQHNPFGNKKR